MISRPPHRLPPGVKIMTGPEIRAARPADGPGPAWGVIFERRGVGTAVKNLLSALLCGLPSAVALRLLILFGPGAVPGWVWAVGGPVLVFCLYGVWAGLKDAAVSLTRRSLIFGPGRIIWLRDSWLKREELVLGHEDIVRLAVTGRPARCALELTRRRADGTEVRVIPLQGPEAVCLWAVDLILDAVRPRTVPFTRSAP